MPTTVPVAHSSVRPTRISCTARRGPATTTNAITSNMPAGPASHAKCFMSGPSAQRSRRGDRSRFVGTQEAEKLHAFAQTPLHHIPPHQHLPPHFPHLRLAEIEPLIEILNILMT